MKTFSIDAWKRFANGDKEHKGTLCLSDDICAELEKPGPLQDQDIRRTIRRVMFLLLENEEQNLWAAFEDLCKNDCNVVAIDSHGIYSGNQWYFSDNDLTLPVQQWIDSINHDLNQHYSALFIGACNPEAHPITTTRIPIFYAGSLVGPGEKMQTKIALPA